MTWRSSEIFVATTICVAIFTDMFLFAVVVPVLPFSLSERAGIADQDLHFWSTALLTAYTAMFLVGSIIFGWATDQISKRSSLLFIGLFLMLGATVMLALSRTIALFMISRIFQGLAGSIVWSAGLALLLDTFGHARFGKMMTYTILCQTSALTVAPVVGGFIFAHFGYDAVLAVCFALVGLDILLRVLLVEIPRLHVSEQPAKTVNTAPDHLTAPTLDDSFTPNDQTPLILKPTVPKHTTSSWYAFVLIGSCPRMLASLLCFAFMWSLQTSFDAVLPYRVRDLFGWSSTGSGLIFLPIVLPAFMAPLSDIFYAKWGARKVAGGLFLVGIPSYACLAFVRHDIVLDRVLLCVLLFLSGLVINLPIAPLTADITYALQALETAHPDSFGENGGYGRTFGMLNCAFSVGGVIGPGLSGLVLSTAGWEVLSLGMGGLCAICLVLVMLCVGGKPYA